MCGGKCEKSRIDYEENLEDWLEFPFPMVEEPDEFSGLDIKHPEGLMELAEGVGEWSEGRRGATNGSGWQSYDQINATHRALQRQKKVYTPRPFKVR